MFFLDKGYAYRVDGANDLFNFDTCCGISQYDLFLVMKHGYIIFPNKYVMIYTISL